MISLREELIANNDEIWRLPDGNTLLWKYQNLFDIHLIRELMRMGLG